MNDRSLSGKTIAQTWTILQRRGKAIFILPPLPRYDLTGTPIYLVREVVQSHE